MMVFNLSGRLHLGIAFTFKLVPQKCTSESKTESHEKLHLSKSKFDMNYLKKATVFKLFKALILSQAPLVLRFGFRTQRP
jgi:hypothetical protein